MDNNSWLLLRHQDPAFGLPPDLAGRDRIGGRDCGWVEQMRPFVRQFCPPDGLVLDPFCGFGTTLLAAQLEGRRAAGIELDGSRAGIARERLARIGAGSQTVVTGNAIDVAPSLAPADLILTNIPYFGCRWPTQAEGASQLYGTSTYADFLDRLHLAFKALKPVLRDDGFLVVMAENLRVGEHFVPMAWDVARILSERYDLVDERVLLYERATQAMGTQATPINNRAHEYALIAKNRPKPIDLHKAWECLQALRKECSDFIVYGSYARWLQGERLARPPSDIDLLVPDDLEQIARLIRWLQAHGFQVARWGSPLGGDAVAAAADGAHYFRAHRLRPDGELCIIDVCFEDAVLDYPGALAHAATIDGIRILPSHR